MANGDTHNYLFYTVYGQKSEADELVKNQNGDCNEPCYYYRTRIYLIMKTKLTSKVWFLWCLAFGVSIKRKNGPFRKVTDMPHFWKFCDTNKESG